MKVLKITAIGTVLAGLVGLAVVLAPSVSAQSFDRLFAGAQGGSRDVTILGGRGGELGVSIVDGKNGVEIDEVHADSAAEKAGQARRRLPRVRWRTCAKAASSPGSCTKPRQEKASKRRFPAMAANRTSN